MVSCGEYVLDCFLDGHSNFQESCHHCEVAKQPPETPGFRDASREILLPLDRAGLAVSHCFQSLCEAKLQLQV